MSDHDIYVDIRPATLTLTGEAAQKYLASHPGVAPDDPFKGIDRDVSAAEIVMPHRFRPTVWPNGVPATGGDVSAGIVPDVRTFATGATRDTDESKLDFEGYLSPLVVECFGEYMQKCALMPDGSRRDSDNWQKGIPLAVYMKSLWRHFFAVWKGHRNGPVNTDDLCGVLFNAMGYLHELLKARNDEQCKQSWSDDYS